MNTRAIGRRRAFLLVGSAGLAVLAAACGGSVPAAAPTSAPAAAPTTAPPTTAPTAAPAAATKPAAPTTAPAAGATQPAAPAATKPAATPAAAAPSKAFAGKQIRLHLRTGSEEDTMKEVLPQFSQSTGIDVKLETFPGGEYYTKVQTLIAGGQLGDVLWTVNYRGTNLWAYSKVTRSLDDLVKADNFDTSQYYKAAIEAGMWEGKLVAMPFKIHPGPCVVYYNVNAVNDAGVKMPEKAFSSWDELVKMAKMLTKPGAGGKIERYGFYTGMTANDPTGTWKHFVTYARSWGGDVYSEDGKKALLAEKPVMDAIRYIHGLVFTEKIAPSFKDAGANADDLFIAERDVLYQSESSTKSIPTRIKGKFDVRNVVLPPGPSGKVGTETIVDHIVMSNATKEPQASWELVKLLCGKEVGIRLGEGTGGASGTSGARIDAVTDPRLTKNPLHPVFVDLLPKTEVVRLAYNFRDEELNNTFHQVSTPIWTGERQPDDAFFKELNDAVQAVLDKPRP
jgi:ABC-type glycerol-3-phosphate transport system substrate-binding protein